MTEKNRHPIAQTTIHVRDAVRGDPQSLGWVVERLSPLLLAHAEYRLGPALRSIADPQDLVNEAWVIALPRLSGLSAREGRLTPVLLRFLTTTLVYRIGRLIRQNARSGRTSGHDESISVAQVVADTRGVPSRAHAEELRDNVRISLDALRPQDREIIILRGIEQHSAKAVAEMLDLSSAAVDQRYSRALKRLRKELPDSVFDELHDGD